MTPEPFDAGTDRILQGDFGEAWLEAVAAGCGLIHNPPGTVDLQKSDVQLTWLGEVEGIQNRTVQVQVKTTVDLEIHTDGTASYELDMETYDALRATNHAVRRVLMVVGLERIGERVQLINPGTLLVGRTAWVSLEGSPASLNASTITVRVPLANTVDRAGLETMLKTYGGPRSTPVPTVDPWTEP